MYYYCYQNDVARTSEEVVKLTLPLGKTQASAPLPIVRGPMEMLAFLTADSWVTMSITNGETELQLNGRKDCPTTTQYSLPYNSEKPQYYVHLTSAGDANANAEIRIRQA